MHKLIVLLGVMLITSCDNNIDQTKQDSALQTAITDVITRSQADMVFVEGGEFMMGDFGRLDKERTGGLYYTNGDGGTRLLHNVKLSNYSISRYQITFHDYLVYRQAQGLDPNPFPIEHITAEHTEYAINNRLKLNNKGSNETWSLLSTDSKDSPQQSRTPAYLAWEAASEYCQWLGEQTGYPYSLPTEAQWEYAARNRGQYVTFATDNGEYEPGHNLPTYEQLQERRQLVGGLPGGATFPVGSFPPSPLGLYDMDANGYEWVKDWFDPNYYRYSPEDNPQGPAEPISIESANGMIVAKVIRGNDKPTDWKITASRWRHRLWQQYTPEAFDGFYYVTARCVVNSSSPIQ